ncbi:unnamed protein product [Mytilus coruscus]|uniref:VWFA domain-containing protein n=1 Tax=Mytilus coruscus TaxID=42192 RepID=A0A6J8AZA2_MYTCO|nr:unnamed protein product [Mytilus coruscus]
MSIFTRDVMKCLFILSLLTSIHQRFLIAALDGSLLSNELKRIKNDIGVNYIQEKFDNFPYETKTDTGSELLQNIQTRLNSSLTDLNEVLNNIKDNIQQADKPDNVHTDLPECCSLPDDRLSYAPEFQTEVDLNTACYTKSRITNSNLKYPTYVISEIMKTNYQNNTNVLWQHYSTTEGISVIYPANKFKQCINFDPRFTSSYAAAAYPEDKDVVIVLDTSSSMVQPSGVYAKPKIVIAKEAVSNVIQTLKEDDRVGIVIFDRSATTPKGEDFHPCYDYKLAFATKANVAKMEVYVSPISESQYADSNFTDALRAAFRYFDSSDDTMDISHREQVILFLSDGKSTGNADPREVIRDENQKYDNRIRIFTYLIGDEKEAMIQLKGMASQVWLNTTHGSIKMGKFQFFDLENQTLLSTVMAQFYLDLPYDDKKDTSIFSVPYVDLFSGVGLITSLCLPVKLNSSLHGVICTDVKISKLLAEVEYFTENEYSYAFIIDKTGRVLMHPLLPNAQFVTLDDDPVLVDISVLEREEDADNMVESMKMGHSGNKTYKKFFIKPRGRLVNDGSSNVNLRAEFFWGPVPKSNFSLCLVLVDDSYSELNESNFPINSSGLKHVFLYHNRNLVKDNHTDCKFYSRRVTFEQSNVKFTQAAFKNPFQYLDRDETADDVKQYALYLTRSSSINPGFREHGIAVEMINRNVLNGNICQDFSKNKNLRSYRVTLPLHIERGFESEVFEMRPIAESNLFIIRVKQKPSLNGCSCVPTSPDDLLCNDHCDCLCHRPIRFDVCTNKYDTKDASPPCSARLPDTSANNEPDILDGLSACFDPACHRKQNKTDCLSEGECSWCEFTDTKEKIETPCCRLKEECTFGKTKFTSRHTCAKPPPTSATRTTDIDKAAIIGATVGCVLMFILIISAVLYCYRHHHPVPDDPYIDAVADMNEISNYIQSERGMNGANDQFPYKCKPEINNLYSESNSF